MSNCARCGQCIYSTQEKIALNKVWHRYCFDCFSCRRPLDTGSAYVCRGEIFCKCCYHAIRECTRCLLPPKCVQERFIKYYPSCCPPCKSCSSPSIIPIPRKPANGCVRPRCCPVSDCCVVSECGTDICGIRSVHSCSCIPCCVKFPPCPKRSLPRCIDCCDILLPREVANYYNRIASKMPGCPPRPCCRPKSPCCRAPKRPPSPCKQTCGRCPRCCPPCCPPPDCCPRPDCCPPKCPPRDCCAATCCSPPRDPCCCPPPDCCRCYRCCPPTDCCSTDCDDGCCVRCPPRCPPRRCPPKKCVPKVCCRPRSCSPFRKCDNCCCECCPPISVCTPCCRRCGRKVYAAERVLASGGAFHVNCFSCYCCRRPLDVTNVNESNGEIYCKHCYNVYFGVKGICNSWQ